MNLIVKSEAVFSECRQYRFSLWRRWDKSIPPVTFLMLNPSTADEIKNDPTVERCQRRAVSMRAGGVVVANIFALRSTDPQALYSHADPVGPGNDAAIVMACSEASMVICAWGGHGKYMDRDRKVLELLKMNGIKPYCLQINSDGTPKHPLYVGYAVAPIPYEMRIKS